MADLKAFLPQVLPFAPGCPDSVAIEAVRNACIEFCEKSLILQETLALLDVDADEPEYTVVSTPTTTKPERVLRAWYNGNRIWPMNEEQIAEIRVDPNTSTGVPMQFYQRRKNKVNLSPIPLTSLAAALRLHIAYAPSRVATVVDDILFDEYYEDIAAGARYNLLLQPEKAYTNAALAQVQYGFFQAGWGKALIQSRKSFTDADVTVKYRRIW